MIIIAVLIAVALYIGAALRVAKFLGDVDHPPRPKGCR